MARKEKQYHFIYKTTCLLNGKYYYGMHSTDNLDDGYYGSGRRLKHSLNKYGKENHKIEIIEYLPNRKSLIEREKEIVNLNEIAKEDCMNLMVGGRGGFISDEQQRYRSICANKVRNEKLKNDEIFRNNLSKSLSIAAKKNHINGIYNNVKHVTFSNKKHTEKTKLKMSNSHMGKGIGENNSQYGTCWITKDGVNKKICKTLIEKYYIDGWVKGRKL